ncbi:phage baseplate assembly protein domain-containing protein [Xenorhabdus anantnagensis]|uniref:Phage baseplate assembly protein n=1 Tax=Xenorhabdus anantnagensis TaxID=3025875 RepID=A0ABT5LWN2_9GAMM|nr:phage baseplate assembly protein [Xenorhabdus anantnagensis]MDC9598720.1 phage baseplate assembly protein [Xenorhabdus anantnagensis]
MDVKNLYRRAMMMLGLGRVTTCNDSGVIQQVQYQTVMEVRDNTKRIAEFGFSSGLPAETDVVLAFLGGDRSNAVVIGSNHQQYRHKGLNPGEVVVYNQWGLHILLTESGITVEAQGQPITVNNASQVTVNASTAVLLNTPVLRVSGDIIDNCNSNNATMKQLRDNYNEHTHPVPGVRSGDSTVTSRTTGATVK